MKTVVSKLLICGAFYPEIRVLKRLSDFTRSSGKDSNLPWDMSDLFPVQSCEIQLWESSLPAFQDMDGEEFEVLPLGIGSFDAGISLSSHLAQNPQIHSVLFIGTAGYNPLLKSNECMGVGEVVVGQSAFWWDSDLGRGESYLPEGGNSPYHAQCESLFKHIRHLRELDRQGLAVSTAGISLVDPVKHPLAPSAPHSAIVENLEVFGVIRTLQKHKIKGNFVLGITNTIHASASQQWRKNHIQCSVHAQKVVLDFLQREKLKPRQEI